jgi:pentatricopeptide repeat protein
MRHVLDARRSLLEPLLERSRNRQERPVLLDDRSSDLDGAQRARAMLQRLVGMGKATAESFEIVMQAFVRRDRMRWQNRTVAFPSAQGDDDNAPSSPPSSSSSSSSSSSLLCAADQVEELWAQLLESSARSREAIPVSCYNLVLQAYANCASPRGDKGYASRAVDVYDQLEAAHGENPRSQMHVLHAHAWEQENMGSGLPAQQAQAILNTIEVDLAREDRMQCYDWVLEAWSKSGSAGSAEHALDLFDKMKRLNETLGGSDVLDSETYSNVILAWSKAGGSGSSRQCLQLLTELLEKYRSGALGESEPPLIAFNGVITAFGRERRPDEAEKILSLMQQLRPICQHLVPDAISYNSVLHAYLRASFPPDVILDKALRLVKYMQDNSHDQPAISPNAFTYATLLKCWLQTGREDRADSAEAVLVQIERAWRRGDRSLQPNNRLHNMVINAYAKSRLRWASTRAMELLSRMKDSNAIEPDTISYTSVLECLSKSADPNAPQHAQELLDEVTCRYEATKDPNLMPNLRTFTMAILTFSKNHGSVAQARGLLTRLTKLYAETDDPQLEPSEYPYNYVLNCAANAQLDQDRAFAIATETFQEMRKSPLVRPDSFTYAFWLKCCNNLLPVGDLRTKCVSFAFDECRKAGLVSNEVLTRLFQGTPPRAVDQLLELPKKGTNYRTLTVNDLPPAWSRNAARRP